MAASVSIFLDINLSWGKNISDINKSNINVKDHQKVICFNWFSIFFSDKKYLINGEQLGADDFDQDSTIIEGRAEQAHEMLLPAEDYGIFFLFLKKGIIS